MKGKISAQKILEINWGHAKTRVLAAGIELDIFTRVKNGKKTSRQISRATKSSRRGIDLLLNALAGLGLLVKEKSGGFSLTDDSSEFLVRGKPRYLGDMSLHSLRLSKAWFNLTDCIRSGKPYFGVDEKGRAEDFIGLVRGLFQMNYAAAKYAALYVKKKHKEIYDVLDVAAGSGVWGIAIAQEFRTARITALDYPRVLSITQEYVNRFNLADRYKYIEGDLRKIYFGKELFDAVVLGHICHSEGSIHTKQLIKKSFRVLKKQGALLIAEFLANDNKTGPIMPLLFALNMLLNTNEGDCFTLAEFRQWLRAAGFKQIYILDKAPAVSPLILAVKR
jgi:ubiquinone/menaquinone biosynthesis C-methylase UbiE